MKKITLLAVSLIIAFTAMADGIVYFKNTLGWENVYVCFYENTYWDNEKGSGSWAQTATQMTLVEGKTDIFQCEYTGTFKSISFIKDKQDNYENFWQTEAVYREDFNSEKPLFTPETVSNETKNETRYFNNGEWSVYVTELPSVSFTLPACSILNEVTVFAATATNVANPVYIYSVKTQDGEYATLSGNTWTPTVEGVYSIKVEVKEGEDGEIVAVKEVSTTVVFKPEEITIKVQIPEGLSSWDASAGVYFYVWPLDPAFVATTSESDNWYSYTFNTDDIFPLNFIVVNGASWEAIIPEGGTASDSRRQSVDMVNIVASGCYVMANGSEIEGDGNSWKKVLNPAECPDPGTSTGLLQNRQEPLFTIENRVLNIELEEAVMIRIYNLGGQMVDTQFTNRYSRLLGQGTYILHIGDTATKAIVF